MSDATPRTQTETDGTPKRIEAAADRLARVLEQGITDDERSETVAELRDVIEEAGQLLETIDLESLPEAIDFDKLPELVDVGQLPTAIKEGDPDAALDLHTIHHAIRLRKLWNSIDLVEFAKEKAQLEDELANVVGEDALSGAGNSEAAKEVQRFVDRSRSEGKNAAMQQQAQKGVSEARRRLVATHSDAEDRYQENQRGPGYVGRRAVSRNPTAVSLVPRGPIPDSSSTRFSSVPTNVRGAKIDALPRIYGRRWKSIGRDR